MLKPNLLKLMAVSAILLLHGCGRHRATLEDQADAIVKRMSLHEKIGQKIIMSFRYWCTESRPDCSSGMTQYNDTVGETIAKNKIGGLILFSDNLTDIDQTAELIWQLKRAVVNKTQVGLFISIDQEGGNVARLPRNVATNFSGNMALGAAYLATDNAQLASQEGRVLAAEIGSVGFNVNFAPVVDVNSNPLNPVINVRAYGDDPEQIGLLGGEAAQAMSRQRVIGTFKHFPGHGDTATDSHYGLPVVNKSRQQAYAIDLAPYQTAIKNGNAPDMIMTAHIQYPELDNSTIITSKTHEAMITPATLSQKIQHDILRDEFGYQGVTVTDALSMRGIADFFEPSDAVIKTFQAGVDIALMPIEFRTASDTHKLSELINDVVRAAEKGQLKKEEIDASVKRIVLLKLRRGITNRDLKDLDTIKQEAHNTIGKPAHQSIAKEIAAKSITVYHALARTS